VNIQPEMQIAGLSIDNSPPIESTTADPAVGSNPSVIDSLVYAFGDETALWETITTYPAKVRVQTIDILGKLKRSSVLPTLICALRDEHWEVRAAAAQALGEAGNPIVIEALIRTLCDETDVIAKQAMVRALGKQRDMQSRSTLTFLLRRDEDCLVREAAAWALGLFQEKAPVQHLAYALAHDSDELVRTAAARALGMTGATGAKAARPALKDAFKNERDTSVQTAIMEALQRLEDEQGTSFSHDVL